MAKNFSRTCVVAGKQGRFFLVRKGRNTSRVISVNGGDSEIVKTGEISDEQEVPTPEKESTDVESGGKVE